MEAKTLLGEDSTFTVPDHVLSREAAGETVLLNLENEQYYGLNGVGTALWELVEGGTAFGRVISILLGRFEIDRESLEHDLVALIADLRRNGLLRVDGT